MKTSQLCIGNYTFGWYSFGYFLDSMEKLEVKKIELWAAAPHFPLEDINYHKARECGKNIKNHGMQVCCLTPEQYRYPINIAASDEDERRRSIAYFKKAIDIASVLECPKIIVASGHCCFDEDRSEAWKRNCEALCELAHGACFKGITVMFETMHRQIDLIHTAEEAKDVLDQVDFYPGIRAMIDLDTSWRFQETPKNFIDLFGLAHFGHVHLNDGLPGGHLAPGDGKLPLCNMLEELDRVGYCGDIALEVLNERYSHQPEDVVRRTIQFFASCCGE